MAEDNERPSKIASQTGEVLAYVQHTLDVFTQWGFAMLRIAAKERGRKEAVSSRRPLLTIARSTGRKMLKFLGDSGSAYYETYEKLKAKRWK